MGNSGWCMSKHKEEEYWTGEQCRSRNCDIMSDIKEEEENARLDALMDEITLRLTSKSSADKAPLEVSFS